MAQRKKTVQEKGGKKKENHGEGKQRQKKTTKGKKW